MIHPHSATVRMTLRAGGQEMPLAQMGPDFIILKSRPAIPIPAGPALMTLGVDGVAEEIPITLPAGISTGERRAAILEKQPELAEV